jgi:hypothetical protein
MSLSGRKVLPRKSVRTAFELRKPILRAAADQHVLRLVVRQ